MKFFRLLIIVTLLVCCKSQKYKTYLNVKEEHERRMNVIKDFPGPFENQVNDSMKSWIPILKKVYTDDQKYRIVGYGMTPDDWKKQSKLDSQNLQIVIKFLDEHEWPAVTDIGLFGQRAVNMVIQHSPLKVQEKYYPSLIKVYKKDSLLFETVAMLEDRINMRRGRYQYYGSQVIYYRGKPTFYPIYKVDSADIRRKILHPEMPDLKKYMNLLNGEFNLSEYKKILPQLIDSFKVSDTAGLHFDLK